MGMQRGQSLLQQMFWHNYNLVRRQQRSQIPARTGR